MSYLFAFSYYSRDSQGKNTEVVCHSLFQWTKFCQALTRRDMPAPWLSHCWSSWVCKPSQAAGCWPTWCPGPELRPCWSCWLEPIDVEGCPGAEGSLASPSSLATYRVVFAFYFWLTSLGMIISRSIHVAANGNISLFSWLINIPHCLYPLICWWTFRLLPCLLLLFRH